MDLGHKVNIKRKSDPKKNPDGEGGHIDWSISEYCFSLRIFDRKISVGLNENLSEIVFGPIDNDTHSGEVECPLDGDRVLGAFEPLF